jgi:fructokinase
VIEASLALANVVKLNEEELLEIAKIFPSQLGNTVATNDLAISLLQSYKLEMVALTRGPRGTVIFTSDGRYEGTASSSVGAVADADSVGAGDACCAGLVYGLLRGWSVARTLDLANRLGAYVASQPGGTPMPSDELLKVAQADQYRFA